MDLPTEIRDPMRWIELLLIVLVGAAGAVAFGKTLVGDAQGLGGAGLAGMATGGRRIAGDGSAT